MSAAGDGDAAAPRALATRAAGTLAANGIAFASLLVSSVLIARMLGLEGRGTVAAAVLLPTLIAYAGELGLPAATAFLFGGARADRRAVAGTARTIALGISMVLIPMTLALTFTLPIADAARTPALAFAAFVPLNLVQRVHLGILQADLRMRALNATRIAGSAAYVLALAALPTLDAASVHGVVAALLVAHAAVFALSAALVPRGPLFRWDAVVARRLISYGLRAHLGSMSPIDSLRVDQLIVAIFLPAHVLGVYVTAMTFAVANRIIGVSIGTVAFPVARTLPTRALRPFLLLIGATAVLGGLAATFEIAFGRRLLEILFGPDFGGAYNALVILAVASVLMNVRGVTGDWLRGAGRPGIAALGEVVLLAVLLPGFVLLWNGRATGVASAVLVASAAALVATALLARRHTDERNPGLIDVSL